MVNYSYFCSFRNINTINNNENYSSQIFGNFVVDDDNHCHFASMDWFGNQ